jgi:hypothetical protein
MLNINILIPVWGEKYIIKLFGLPIIYLLSEQNLPLLAKYFNVTITFLITSQSKTLVENYIKKSLLIDYNIKIILIDDLYANCTQYPLVLTLSYLRGIISTGAQMTQTYFIFFNSDFVIANTSFYSIIEKINEKYDVILATSFRIKESASDIILNRYNKDETILKTRDLAKIALDNVHLTNKIKVVNGDNVTSNSWTQIYWQVDRYTYLVRYFLSTLFCLKPTVYKTNISCFYDYSLVEEFCPNYKFTTIDDSDNFFMAELQADDSEAICINFGQSNSEFISKSVASWALNNHINSSKYNIIIHGLDIPNNIKNEITKFNKFMDTIYEKLPLQILDFKNHYQWFFYLEEWLIAKSNYEAKLIDNNDQLNIYPLNNTGLSFNILDNRYIYKSFNVSRYVTYFKLIVGLFPFVTLFHPLFHYIKFIKTNIKIILNKNDNILLITDTNYFDPLFTNYKNVSKKYLFDFIKLSKINLVRFNCLVIFCNIINYKQITKLIHIIKDNDNKISKIIIHFSCLYDMFGFFQDEIKELNLNCIFFQLVEIYSSLQDSFQKIELKFFGDIVLNKLFILFIKQQKFLKLLILPFFLIINIYLFFKKNKTKVHSFNLIFKIYL